MSKRSVESPFLLINNDRDIIHYCSSSAFLKKKVNIYLHMTVLQHIL